MASVSKSTKWPPTAVATFIPQRHGCGDAALLWHAGDLFNVDDAQRIVPIE